jgi:hypothetical protein
VPRFENSGFSSAAEIRCKREQVRSVSQRIKTVSKPLLQGR